MRSPSHHHTAQHATAPVPCFTALPAPPGTRPQVQYAALSHFEERYEDFQADAVHLRRRFAPDGERGGGGGGGGCWAVHWCGAKGRVGGGGWAPPPG